MSCNARTLQLNMLIIIVRCRCCRVYRPFYFKTKLDSIGLPAVHISGIQYVLLNTLKSGAISLLRPWHPQRSNGTTLNNNKEDIMAVVPSLFRQGLYKLPSFTPGAWRMLINLRRSSLSVQHSKPMFSGHQWLHVCFAILCTKPAPSKSNKPPTHTRRVGRGELNKCIQWEQFLSWTDSSSVFLCRPTDPSYRCHTYNANCSYYIYSVLDETLRHALTFSLE